MKTQIKRTLLLLFIAIMTAAAAVMVIMTTTGNDRGAQPAAESTPSQDGSIKQIIAGKGSDSFVLFDNNKLFGTGSDSHGQLGKTSQSAISDFTLASTLPDGNVTSVACGSYNTMAVVDGQLYAVGDNFCGELGRENEGRVTNTHVFENVPFFNSKNIVSVAVGDTNAMVIACDKSNPINTILYSSGNITKGALGNGKDTGKQFRFDLVEGLGTTPLDLVACGGNYGMVLTNEGDLYGTGSNENGRLGFSNDVDHQTIFTQISLPASVERKPIMPNSIVAGLSNAALIDTSGQLYVTGKNDYGQLGLGDTDDRYGFTKVAGMNNVSSVTLGQYYTAVLTSDGKLFFAGHNGSGQMGLGTVGVENGFELDTNKKPYRTSFVEVTAFEGNPLYGKTIKSVICGKNHTMVLTDEGELYVAGNNGVGQLGLGDTTHRKTFTKVLLNYTVTFDGNGGSKPDGASVTQTIPYHKATPLPANPFTKEGCTFVGWAETSGDAENGNVTYTDEQPVTYLANVNESTTLYAVWKPDAPEVIITTQDNIDTIIYGDGSITLTANTPEYTDIEYIYQWLYKSEEDADFAAVNYATEKTLVRKNVKESGLYKVIVIATLKDKNVKSYPTTSEAKQITIKRAALSSLKVSIDNWTYGENAKVPVVTDNPGGGAATYHYSGTTNGGIEYDSTDQPTDAGSYTVTATIPETENYLEATTAAYSFSIERADQTLTVDVNGWTYGETPIDPVVIGNDGKCEYLYEGKANNSASYSSSKAPGKAGTYTVTVTAAQTDNYKAGTMTSNEFEIERATLTPELTLDSWTYGETPSMPVLKGNDGKGAVKLTYTATDLDGEVLTQTYGTLAALDAACRAGTDYTLEVIIQETDNYKQADISINFNVNRKKISAPEIRSKVFNGYGQTAGIAGTDDYKEKEKGQIFGPAIGEYAVVLELNDPVNTEWSEGGVSGENKELLTLTFRIVGAENIWTTEPSIPNVKYGEKISPKYAAAYENEKVTITYYKDNNRLTGAPTAVGHYKATFTIDETIEYTGLKKDTEFDILPKDITVTIENKRQVYNGEELELTWSTPDGSIIEKDDLGIKLSREPGKDAGAYAITGEWNNNVNYNVTFKNGVYTIAKAKYDMKNVAFAGKTVTYDGNEYGLEVTGLPAGVSVEYTGNNKTNAGEYTITATFTAADTKNYEELETKELTATLKIEKATYDMKNVAFADKKVTYDGSVHSLKVTGLPAGVSVEYAENNKTNAGEYLVTATFTAADTKNYEELETKELTALLKIAKATYDMKNVAFADKTVTYDGSVHGLKVTGLPAGVSVEYTENNKTNADEYTVTATFTAADTTNHEPLDTTEMTATLTIEKAKYDTDGIKFAGSEVTYNSEIQSLYVEGLPAGVSVKYIGNDKRNAGEYEVTAVFTVDENHEAIGSMTATLKINKAKYVLPTFESKTVTYDGESHSLKVTGVPYGVTVEYEGNGKKEAGTYTVTAKFTGDANYEAIGDLTATLTIEEKGGCGSVVVDGATIAGITISVLAFASFLAVRKAKSRKK